MKLRCLVSFLIIFFAGSAWACGIPVSLQKTSENLASPSQDEVQRAVATLRAAGPAGLTEAIKFYDSAPDARLIPAIEAIAGQRGAVISRLYWYTVLDEAKTAAKAQNKPILYLRMLGKLTDEYSCANSRFFRTVLYSNAGVSKILREQFVLVWVSERPVPVVTIDYGDGRLLKRTLTGNSIHYVLDADGNVIDAVPGLYGPLMFRAVIAQAAQIAMHNPGVSDSVRVQYLARQDDQMLNIWKRYAAVAVDQMKQSSAQGQTVVVRPPADRAMMRAVSKSAIEAPLLRQVSPQFAAALDESVDKADAATWNRIAADYATYSMLDASSVAVIQSENPKAYQDPAVLKQTVDQFQKLIALDTVHNHFQYRRQILGWLRADGAKINVEQLNKRVYAELFLTPAADPWLGLMPQSTYTALCDDGCVAK